jgi:hypothetical protein
MATCEKFLRFLSAADPVLRVLGNFELVYVAHSEFNFPAARAALWSRFSDAPRRSAGLFDDEVRSVVLEPRVAIEPHFTTVLFEYSYPRLQRSELRGSRDRSHAAQ